MELQRDAVHAVAQTRRRRSVGEDMAEMPAAAMTVHFGALLADAVVVRRIDGVRQRFVETRPTRPTFEFRFR